MKNALNANQSETEKGRKEHEVLQSTKENGQQDKIFLGNELYTEKEAQKYFGALVWLDPVEISKNKTYYMFGARFEIGTFQESI